jgi:hypothetical protein
MPEELPTNRGRTSWRRAAILVAAVVVGALIVWAGVELYKKPVDSSAVDQVAPEATE